MEELSEIRLWGVPGDDQIRSASMEGMDSRAEKLENRDWAYEVVHGKFGLNVRECRAMIEKAQVFIGEPLKGVAVDLGSGIGTLAGVLTCQPGITQVYAVEYSREHLERVMPHALPAMGADMKKLIRCWGSFNEVAVPDNFFDIVTEFAAFHHSENLPKTMAEAYRILKPSGWLIAVENVKNAKPDHLTNAEIEALLNKAWGDKQEYGEVAEKVHTRGEWGEHVYRFCDWLHYFAAAGFESYLLRFHNYSRRSVKNLVLEVFFRLFGDTLLRRRVTGISYPSWFERGIHRVVFLCRKPQVQSSPARR